MAKKKRSVILSSLLDDVEKGGSILQRVDQYLYQREKVKPTYVPKGFHPSSLDNETCPRALVYERIGVPNEEIHPPHLQRIFSTGTTIHETWQRHLFSAGVLTEHEVEVPIHKVREHNHEDTLRLLQIPEYRTTIPPALKKIYEKAAKWSARYGLRGHSDGVKLLDEQYNPLPTPEREVLEIKSMKDQIYQRFPAKGVPYRKHLTQSSLYARAFEAGKIVFLYENKNDQTVTELVVQPDKEAVNTALAIVSAAQDHLKDGKLPERHELCPKRTSAKANRCPFVSICFSSMSFSELDRRGEVEPRDYR